jgi:hypothetical protein
MARRGSIPLLAATESMQNHVVGDSKSLATPINAELAEPAEITGVVLRVLRFLR